MKIMELFAKAKKKLTRKKKVKSTLLDRMITTDDPDLFEWLEEPKK